MQLKKRYLITNEDKKLKENFMLDIRNLNVSFKTKDGMLQAVRGVNISARKGQIIGIIGESGSGKSVCVKSLIGFNDNSKTVADNLNLDDIDISKIKNRDWSSLRGEYVTYIPQDPLLSLNPTKKIGAQIKEALVIAEKRKYRQEVLEIKEKYLEEKQKLDQELDKQPSSNELLKKLDELKTDYNNKLAKAKAAYKNEKSAKAIKAKIYQILEFIGINDIKNKVNAYPHEFSGGMRQRIVIGIAIASRPKLIIADEPTTALDVTIQAKVLDLIKKINQVYKVTVIFISHNIALVANFCEYIYVMYAGKIVEQGNIDDIFLDPRHPYTWALISSIPDEGIEGKLKSIPGSAPNLISPPKGDAFAARNEYATKLDFNQQPPLVEITKTHKAATWLLHPDAPKVQLPDLVKQKIEIYKQSLAKLEKQPIEEKTPEVIFNVFDTREKQ
ncbi:ABC transporter ATP-binding protein [Mycoplasma bradburyae]|uniref:ABC transporter ATP-binding protein n=1 Tax=Mycoplasma bradburyae TaxID=2963128 RepID=A0AAW6HS81_9MOLU|nr:ABC transporter ATP-binding protein [Mycoplasma bradburyae]MDC4182804.1 ABC transporter ATP-binding protein [Mycoplasma bradburyae]MDC4183478.1 ABC transporter ATP-binding protein [Mycoplasma bradburyae]UTS70625.1 ABC transporter ATP-binding protein [Mycoplasma bradburyae]